jgi:hypothetical protein
MIVLMVNCYVWLLLVSAAYDVSLTDEWASSFKVDGEVNAKWKEIAPYVVSHLIRLPRLHHHCLFMLTMFSIVRNGRATHNYTVTPTVDGEFASSRAAVQYLQSSTATDYQTGHSSASAYALTIYPSDLYYKLVSYFNLNAPAMPCHHAHPICMCCLCCQQLL